MPSSKPKVTVRFSKEYKFTAGENKTLSKAFEIDIGKVLSRKKGSIPPFPEININSGRSTGTKRPAASKKAGKKK